MKGSTYGLFAFAVLIAPSVGQCAPGDDTSPFGYTTSKAPGKGCEETTELDQATFIRSVPTLKMLGVLNTDYVTQTVVIKRPFTLSMAFLMSIAPDSVNTVFEADPSLKQCYFRAKIKFADDYGNDKTETAFSFDVNRAFYVKVNWGNINIEKFEKIAPHFAFSPAMEAVMAAERADP